LLPFWFVPGVLDWWLHRRTRIEETSGLSESLVHAAMMTEVGVPTLAALVLEANAALLTAMGGAAVLHHVTAAGDVRLAYHSQREVRPSEQHVHAFLEVLPWQALAMVATLHWDQLRAMFGRGLERPDWRLRRKRHPVPSAYVTGVMAAVTVAIGLPYGEELRRCWRARGRQRTS
jgi:hypothetical protein